MEAMRAGLPVIASDVGGVREEVLDNETGFLIPRNDVVTLRERLKCLLVDPNLRARFGEASRRLYETQFTFEHMLGETIKVYKETLQNH